MEHAPPPPPPSPPSEAPGAPAASLRAYAGRVRAGLGDSLRRNRRRLWPAAALWLLCILSAPLLGAWMRWVELPRIVREADLQPCAEAVARLSGGKAGARDATTDAMIEALDAQETALAPRHCIGMRRMDTGTGLRTAAYRFEDGSLFTLHLRAPPPPTTQDDAQRGMVAEDEAGTAAESAIDARAEPPAAPPVARPADGLTEPGTATNADPDFGIASDAEADSVAVTDAFPAPADTPPAQPAPPPILAATCPVQSRQSLLVLAGLLIIGVVVVLHRLRAGGRFFDFRNVVSEPLRAGEALLLIYAFALILGTGIGLQIGGCEAAEHRDGVRVERASTSLKELMAPSER